MAFDADLTLLYQFKQTKSLDPVNGLGPTLTFARAGSATYTDSSGVLQTAGTDAPRFTHTAAGVSLGLFFEGEVRTNAIIRSTDFDHAAWAWTTATHAASAETVPDGSTDGTKMIETNDTASFKVAVTTALSLTNNENYSFAVYVKKGTRSWVKLEVAGVSAPANAHVYFDVNTGAIGTVGAGSDNERIEDAGNGWWRCQFSYTADATDDLKPTVYAADADNSDSYAGTVTDVALHLWGAQHELGEFSSSFIYTTTIAVERAKDVCDTTTVTWFARQTGTWFFAVRSSDPTSSGRDIMSIGDASPPNPTFAFYNSVGGRMHFRIRWTGGDFYNLNVAAWDLTAGSLNRGSGAHANSDYQGYCNGSATAHGTSFSMDGTFTKFHVGVWTSPNFMGIFEEIRYYDVRKNDTFLDDLSMGLIEETPVAPAVISVEKFTLAMPDGSVSTPALSLGQDIDNCVPFITQSSNVDGNDATFIDIAKNTGTNKFDLACHTVVGFRNVEVTVVEFDPAEVTVQEVAFTIDSGLTASVTVTAIVEANTFPIIYAKSLDTLFRWRTILFQATFTSPTNLLLTKSFHGANVTGHAYILEALNGAWTVESGASIPNAYTTAQTTKNVAITVTPSRTGLWSYWDTDDAQDNPLYAIWDGVITDGTNLDLTRGNGGTPSAAGDIESFVVEFADEVAVVQQGEFNYLTATTKTAAINAPGDLGNTMIVGTSIWSYCENNATGFPARDYGQARMTFNSTIEVLGTRDGTGTGNYRQNFQVIEWLIGAVVRPFLPYFSKRPNVLLRM